MTPRIAIVTDGGTARGRAGDVTDRERMVSLARTFDCCQAMVPHMSDAGWGRIVAAARAFRIRDEPSYLTGQIFGVNGGRTIP